MPNLKQSLWITAALWAAFIVIVMATRPALPTSETRALTVAWEMLARHDWLYMTLNYEPYSHKPPILPWLVNIFWALFGVNKAAATMAPAIITMTCAWLVTQMSKNLWPRDDKKATTALWIFFGYALVVVYGTLILYDFLLSVFILTALISLLQAAQGTSKHPWWWLGVSLGLGGLAKGPVILLHVIPVALLAPYWTGQQNWGKWYRNLFGAVILGLAVAMLWAIPAAIHGGPEYTRMIFWEQTAGRVENAFDHAKPWWFYLSLIPVYLLPWLFFKPLWKKTNFKGKTWQTRFLLCWMLPVFIGFSCVSGKQIHYIFALYPALCLAMADVFTTRQHKASRLEQLPLFLYGLIGVAMMMLDLFANATDKPPVVWFEDMPIGYGATLVILCFILVRWSKRNVERIIMATTIAGFATLALVHVAGVNRGFQAFDLRPIAKIAHSEELEKNPEPIAFVGKYEGEFGFLAQLQMPLIIIQQSEIASWHKKYPKGELIACLKPRDKERLLKGWRAEKEELFRTARFCGVYEPPRK